MFTNLFIFSYVCFGPKTMLVLLHIGLFFKLVFSSVVQDSGLGVLQSIHPPFFHECIVFRKIIKVENDSQFAVILLCFPFLCNQILLQVYRSTYMYCNLLSELKTVNLYLAAVLCKFYMCVKYIIQII